MVNFIFVFFSHAARIFPNVAVVFLIARYLGVSEFGVFSFYYVIVSLLSLLLEFGFSIKLVKDIAGYGDNAAKKNQIISYNLLLKHLISSSIFLVSTITMLICVVGFNVDLSRFFLFEFLLLGFICFGYQNFIVYIYQGSSQFKRMSFYSGIGNFLFFIIVSIFIFMTGNLVKVGFGFFLGRLLGFAVVWGLGKVKLYSMYDFRRGFLRKLKPIFLDNMGYFFITFFATAYIQLDAFFVKYFLGYEQVGLYQAGMRLALGFLMFADVMNAMYLPNLSRLISKGRNIELRNKIINYNVYALIFAVSIYLFLSIFDRHIVHILYGVKYNVLVKYFSLFSLLVVIRFLGGPFATIITVCGNNIVRARFLAVALIANFLLNYFLVPRFELYGALYAAILTLVLLNTLYLSYVYYELKSLFVNKVYVICLLISVSFLLTKYFWLCF